jgi:hypothetical protein
LTQNLRSCVGSLLHSSLQAESISPVFPLLGFSFQIDTELARVFRQGGDTSSPHSHKSAILSPQRLASQQPKQVQQEQQFQHQSPEQERRIDYYYYYHHYSHHVAR